MKALIEAHGGTIELLQAEQGTLFLLRLPKETIA